VSTMHKLTIEVSSETFDYLSVLARGEFSGQTVLSVVRRLVHSAADGVRRPGAWERQWVEQAFGTDWQQHLERHPTIEFYDVPRGRT
jgi:hypothetical protein